ncbi:MAG: DUF2934 domain-containing protein [Magnetospirillum sp.]|nr:DUF2934 domain-containing protein [Magnetospirillum sp.]
MSTNSAVKDLAYSLWEAAGQPQGQDMEFWLEAERRLSSAPKAAPKAKAAAKKAPAKAKAAAPKAAKPKAPAKPKAR